MHIEKNVLFEETKPAKALAVDEKNQVVADGLAALRKELEEYRRGRETTRKI